MHGCESCSDLLRQVVQHYCERVPDDDTDELAANASSLGMALAEFFEGDRGQVMLAFSSALKKSGLTAEAKFVHDNWLTMP